MYLYEDLYNESYLEGYYTAITESLNDFDRDIVEYLLNEGYDYYEIYEEGLLDYIKKGYHDARADHYFEKRNKIIKKAEKNGQKIEYDESRKGLGYNNFKGAAKANKYYNIATKHRDAHNAAFQKIKATDSYKRKQFKKDNKLRKKLGG